MTPERKSLSDRGFLRVQDQCLYLGIGRTKLYELEYADPDFPPKVYLSPGCVGRLRSALDEYLRKKQEQARKGVA